MAKIGIDHEHIPALTRFQHTLEWLQGERERLEAEHAHVLAVGQRVQNEMLVFLMQQYGVDPQQPLTVDAEHGVIVTPDATDQPEPAAVVNALRRDATDQPASEPTPIAARAPKARPRAQ